MPKELSTLPSDWNKLKKLAKTNPEAKKKLQWLREKNRLHRAEYNRRKKEENPNWHAEMQAKYREKYRDRNLKYQREYQKQYLTDPINSECHRIRTSFVNNVTAVRLGKPRKNYGSFVKSAEFIAKNITKDKVVNHIIPIRFFVMFFAEKNQSPAPRHIVSDVSNLEIVTRADNSRLRNFITDKVIETAKKMEYMYAESLAGFVEYLERIRPEYQPSEFSTLYGEI